MKTKASTLIGLQGKLSFALILDCAYCTVEQWNKDSVSCINSILSHLPNVDAFVVRSSSQREDQLHTSMAGQFESVLNVSKGCLEKAIEQVITSYGENVSSRDEILIQPMLFDVTMSGVLFTKDPNVGSSYYVVNYDLKGDTAAVTSGAVSGHTTFISRSAQHITDQRFRRLVSLANELESILENSNLDIEFAFDQKENLYLFQVRPLVIKEVDHFFDQYQTLRNIKNKINYQNINHPYLSGNRTILGVMPDWNPAEIIGIRPKPLALSLYKELITDSTWAYQRDNYGYKNLRSFPLIVDLCGLPYIDVRVSFNSFIPKELDSKIADKLVNYYLDRLEKEPFLHDKVEFEIVFSCYTFDIKERIKTLQKNSFDQEEIESVVESLRNLTNRIIHKDKGLWLKDIQKIEELKQRHDIIFSNQDFDELTKIYWLIEDCKRYGTLPFAGLARAGFIAVQLLNSMVSVGILSVEERLRFLNSLDSVSTKITQDLHTLSKEQFLKKYGHLRPGTYDILSPRYDETPDLYFNWGQITHENCAEAEEFKLSLTQMKKIEDLLDQNNLEHDVVGLFSFMKAAIEGREYSKFVFTKTLSDILSLLKNYTHKHNISLEDLAFIDIKKLHQLHSTSWNVIDEIKTFIEDGKEKHFITSMINLPPLIIKADDVDFFNLPENKPNFITVKTITSRIVTDLSDPNKLQGSIVFIPSADHGFDWIFTRGITGFITAYGGVNSHMAIRAGELGLPAVIGAGEKLYNLWKQANMIHINCANHRVEIVH